MQKILIASDHGGFNLKNIIIKHLTSKNNIDIKDCGCYNIESCDYPTYAKIVAEAVNDDESLKGILVCGSGIGMSIAANKFKNVRAALCSEPYSASMSRKHNNSNILCLGERIIGTGIALNIVDTWLNTEFEGGRHLKRIEMI